MIFHATDFLIIPIIFYIVVAAARLDLHTLREEGWLFNTGTARDPWYKFYTLYGSSVLCWPSFRSPFDFSRLSCHAMECHLGNITHTIRHVRPRCKPELI